jgi:dihydroneopterin triphosphate diphosphatase
VRFLKHTHVEAYVFRRRRGRAEFLALRRSPSRRHLPGVWQPVTGKISARETSLLAAIREVREETGLVPRRWWAVEGVTTYFDAHEDALYFLPLFAAEVGARERVVLSKEHDDYRFLPVHAAARRYLWQAQRTALEAIRRQILPGGALARALEIEAPEGEGGRAGKRRGMSRAVARLTRIIKKR